MKTRLITFLIICFGLISCMATLPAPQQVQNSFPIDKPFETVWQSVIETCGELNLPIINMEKVSGLISTDWINLPIYDVWKNNANFESYCDCGKLGANVEVKRRGRVNVYVKKVGDLSCEIKVNSVFEHVITSSLIRNDPNYTNSCVSTGKLELEVFKRVTEKLK